MIQELAAFKSGKFLIVVDHIDRENEGDLIVLAENVTAEQVAFMVRYTTGILCVAITEDRARHLKLPMMVNNNQDRKQTAFTVSVDAISGITTGVSAQERATTVRALAAPSSKASDFVRPGHIYPLIADRGGLTVRAGHTEAGVALAALVGAQPTALISEIVNDDGSMARGAQLIEFSAKHNIPIITIDELTEYSRQNLATPVREHFEPNFDWANLPTDFGSWQIATFMGLAQSEHVISKYGDVDKTPMVRIHSECLTGDVLHSLRCDCGEQLQKSMAMIAEYGHGYLIYMRGHEGRGIGLTEKLKAYLLQDQGLDTVDANLALGHPVDARNWSDASEILRALKIKSLILLTNNPLKVAAVEDIGIKCEQRSIFVADNEFNAAYLNTKADRMGHTNISLKATE